MQLRPRDHAQIPPWILGEPVLCCRLNPVALSPCGVSRSWFPSPDPFGRWPPSTCTMMEQIIEARRRLASCGTSCRHSVLPGRNAMSSQLSLEKAMGDMMMQYARPIRYRLPPGCPSSGAGYSNTLAENNARYSLDCGPAVSCHT